MENKTCLNCESENMEFVEHIYGETGGGNINGKYEGKVGGMWCCNDCGQMHSLDSKGWTKDGKPDARNMRF